MIHLSREHLLDVVDNRDGLRLPERVRQHLAECESCRVEAATLRAVLVEVRDEPGGEPSPLFWDHFAARVAEAIRDEAPEAAEHVRAARQGAETARRSVWGLGGRTAAWAAVALTIVLGSTMVAWRATRHAPAVRLAADAAGDLTPAADLDDDQAWKIVRAAADGLQWEDVQAAGIAARPGAAEGVAMELSADERAELAHLLETEMKRSGA